MSSIINNPTVTINNNPVPVIANSVSFDEGLGEQTIRIESTGGGNVTQVYADNIEMKKSKVNFSLLPTVTNINNARSWKLLKNTNAITISGTDSNTGDQITRTFTACCLISNYTINMKTDGNIDLEFEGNSAA